MDRLSFRVMAQKFAVGLFLAALVFMGSKTAYADPHAVFYTATGQQQLFYNVLAGLNQADYVEPANPQTGTPPGQSRSELLQARNQAGFQPTVGNDQALQKSATQLSTVLTRGVTLEGEDVWSTYEQFQLNLESVRRQESARLLTVLCERTLGVKGCDQNNNESPKVAQARIADAYVADPVGAAQETEGVGQAVLLSGTAYDQQVRQGIVSNVDGVPDKFRPYDPYIAALRNNATSSSPAQTQYVNSLLDESINATVGGNVDSNVLQELSTDSNGDLTLPDAAGPDDYIDAMIAAVNQPNQIYETRLNAEAQQDEINAVKDVNGVVADTYAKPITNSDGTLGTIQEILRAPAEAKISELETASNVIGDGTVTRYYTQGDESLPGNTNLVRPTPSAQPGDNQTSQAINPLAGQVAGISSDQALSQDNPPNLVESATDLSATPEPSLPPNTNPVGFDEDVAIPFLDLIIGGDDKGGCGSSCSVNNVIDGYANSIINP